MRGVRLSRSARPAALALACALAGPALAQHSVGYAQATGYYKRETRPTLYQPLNLLDGREATVFCTPGSDTLNEKLTFGFKGVVRIDEVRIYTGNGSDDAAFQEFGRARKLTLQGQGNGRTVVVADQRGLQAVPLEPPLVGSFFTVEIVEQYPAEDPEMPVCVTDIVFYSNGKPLNGPWMTQRLKYDKNRAPLLGTWFSGYQGAPDRFLSFFFDGTFRLTYEPFEGRPRAFAGTYSVRGTRVVLDLPGKGKSSARLERKKASEDDPLAPAREMKTLDFEGGPDDLKKPFRDVP